MHDLYACSSIFWADSEAATQLIDSQPEEQRPGAVIGDTAYGTGQVRADMEERHIQVIAPAPAEPQRPGHLPKSAFQIDRDTETCRCPGGQTAAEKRHSKSGQLKAFAFSQEQCGNCPLKGQCTQSKHNRRIVTVHPQEKHLQAARVYQKTKEFQETYPDRHKVERKQAEMTRHGVRKARYIGQAKVKLQALMIAADVDLMDNSSSYPQAPQLLGQRSALTTYPQASTTKSIFNFTERQNLTWPSQNQTLVSCHFAKMFAGAF